MNSPLANKLLRDVSKELSDILPFRYVVPFIEIKNLKSCLGKCHKITENYYQIQLSRYLLDCDLQLIKNVIAHELIHTVDGCFNHGSSFVRYTNLINKIFPQYKVEVKNTNKQFEEQINYKYQLTCEKCGKVFYRNRLPKNRARLYHTQCKGHLLIEEL